MSILAKIKDISFAVATFGKIGEWKGGFLLASLAAFPVLFLTRGVYDIAPDFYYWFFAILLILSFVCIYLAINFISDKYPSVIVLDKVLGMMLTFFLIPLKFKLMLFGFILFHAINLLRPYVFSKNLGQRIDDLPLGLGIIAGDLVSGLMSNIILQLMVWVVG